MMRLFDKTNVVSFLLLAPLIAFFCLMLVWPLAVVMKTAVYEPSIADVFVNTAEAMEDWDRASPPSTMMLAAVARDLREAQDDQLVGAATRRLNSLQPGFRTLISRTRNTLRRERDEVDLIGVDPRWVEPAYWRAIASGLGRYTDRNFLAAVDLERAENGFVVNKPEATSANRIYFLRTFVVSGVVTLACLVLGLPYALLAASTTGNWRQILLAAVLLPLWTSLLVRTTAWFILLQDQGVINGLLMSLGIADSPLPLIFNRLGVIVAMTHVLLPFMVLPIFSVLISIPKNLMPAAYSLGASPLRAFFSVILPLSFRGIASGSILVFMSAIGYYITPALIGGPGDQLISTIVAFYALETSDWGMASAIGIVLLVVTVILYLIYIRVSDTGTEARSS